MLLVAAGLFSCALNGPGAPLPPAVPREYHVRAVDPRVRDWIGLGATYSRTFSQLLDRLGRSDLIVYVQIVDRIPGGATGRLLFVTSTHIARYLRIELDGRGNLFEIVSL